MVAKLSELLSAPGAARAYLNLHCSEYVVDDAAMTAVVGAFWTLSPANGTAGAPRLCTDRYGGWLSFYRCASARCAKGAAASSATRCDRVALQSR